METWGWGCKERDNLGRRHPSESILLTGLELIKITFCISLSSQDHWPGSGVVHAYSLFCLEGSWGGRQPSKACALCSSEARRSLQFTLAWQLYFNPHLGDEAAQYLLSQETCSEDRPSSLPLLALLGCPHPLPFLVHREFSPWNGLQPPTPQPWRTVWGWELLKPERQEGQV